MRISTRCRRSSQRFTAVSAIVSAALLGSVLPAQADADFRRSGDAQRTAAVVERVTGAEGLAPATALPGASVSSIARADGLDVTVVVPERATGAVHFSADGSEFGLGLPGVTEVAGVKSAAGTVVYPDAAQATDIAVQTTTDGGARALTVLKDSGAATSQRYELSIPDGIEILPDGDGGYRLARESQGAGNLTEVIGVIDAPWAKDAAGKDVPTRYVLEGSSLVQIVETKEDTRFPVVADPKVTFGKFVYVKFGKKEVKKYAKAVKYSPGGAVVCSALGIPLAVNACGVILGARLAHLSGVWGSAARYGKCVEMKFSYVPVMTYINAKNYKC